MKNKQQNKYQIKYTHNKYEIQILSNFNSLNNNIELIFQQYLLSPMNQSLDFSIILSDQEMKGIIQTNRILEAQNTRLYNLSYNKQLQLKAERTQRLNDVLKLSMKIVGLEEKVKQSVSLRKQYQKLTNSLSQQKNKVTYLSKKIDELQALIQTNSNKHESLNQQNIKYKERTKQLQEELSKIQVQKILKEQKHSQHQSRQKELQDKFHKINNQFQKLQLILKSKQEQFTSSLNQKDIQISSLSSKLSTTQQNLTILSHQHSQATKTIQHLLHQSNNLASQRLQHNQQDQALKITLDTVNHQLKSHKHKIQQLQSKNEKLLKMNKQCIKTIEKLTGKNLSLSNNHSHHSKSQNPISKQQSSVHLDHNKVDAKNKSISGKQ